MDVKEQTRKAYELFGKGDMETFFNDMIDDNIVWTFPGKEGVHPCLLYTSPSPRD